MKPPKKPKGPKMWIEAFRSPAGDLPFLAMDFVNGKYWLNGSDVAVTDLLTDDPDGNFLETSITASGMEVTADRGIDGFNKPYMTAAAVAAIVSRFSSASGVTGVYQQDNVDGQIQAGGGICLGIYNDVYSSATEGIEYYGDMNFDEINVRVEPWTSGNGAGSGFRDPVGLAKSAFNLARPDGGGFNYDISMDGGGVNSSINNPSPATFGLDTVTVGFGDAATEGAGTIFKSIAFYDLQPVADLPALSAL